MNAAIKNVAFAITLSLLTSATSAPAEISTTQLRQQTRKQLRLEATAASGQAQDDAAAALCDLYVVLRSDPRYGTSDMLQGDAAKVRKRLMTIARRREIQLGRKGIARPTALSRQVDSAIRAALEVQELEDQKTATSESNEARSADPVAGGGAAAGAGWQLVELIERIVAPDFWESRGGVGSIQYFAMRRVLVVRATSDVHQQVKDLLMALR